MIKVLRIINRFNLGGPTFNVAYLTKYLPDDFQTILIGGNYDKTEKSSEFILENINIKPIIIPEMQRKINPKNDLIAYKKIKAIIKETKPDIVHTHASKAGTIGRLAAYNSKVPIIVHTFHGHVFHSYFSSYKAQIFKQIERSLAKKTTRIIAISEEQKNELVNVHKIAKNSKFTVIPLGFDLQKFQINIDEKRKAIRQEFDLKEDEVAIAIIGRLVPIKNHNLLLESLKYLKQKAKRKFKVFIVGDGEMKENIMLKAKELEISFSDFPKTKDTNKTIIFTSWRQDIDSINAGMDIIALTSMNEGTPVSLIEAQAANNAIISTKVGGINDIVIENETALLCKNGSIEDFSCKLLQLVDNQELRKKLSKKGWEFVKEQFHYKTLVKNTANLYYSLYEQYHQNKK